MFGIFIWHAILVFSFVLLFVILRFGFWEVLAVFKIFLSLTKRNKISNLSFLYLTFICKLN